MKRSISILIGLLICTSMFSMSVSAVTNQGLEWGFNTGDEFHFMLYADGEGLFVDEEIYIEANATTLVPDSITNWTDIPLDTLRAYYANGTELGIEYLLLIVAYNIGLPIGNWSFLSGLAEDTHSVENFTLDSEDPYFWGYSWEDDDWNLSSDGWTLWSIYSLSVHVDYLKIDGFISHYSVIATNTTTKEKTGEINMERMGIEQYTDRTAPILNHPADIEYVLGNTGYNITWSASDENPVSYQIFKDGTEVTGNNWVSTTEEFTIIVDDLEIGEFNYTISVVDVGGNTASDEVTVTVLEPDIPLMDNLLIIGLIGGVGVIILVIVVVFRRR